VILPTGTHAIFVPSVELNPRLKPFETSIARVVEFGVVA